MDRPKIRDIDRKKSMVDQLRNFLGNDAALDEAIQQMTRDGRLDAMNRDLDAVVEQAEERSVPPGGKRIWPQEGFLVKVLDLQGRKHFVNICGSSDIAAPGAWPGGQMPEEVKAALAQSDAGSECLRFPLSMGQPRMDMDHQNQPCTTTDCIFNASVVEQAEHHRGLKSWLIKLALQWMSEKHDVQLESQWKLPKTRYRGEKVAQVVRSSVSNSKPAVQEVGINGTQAIQSGSRSGVSKHTTKASAAKASPSAARSSADLPQARGATARTGGSSFAFGGAKAKAKAGQGASPSRPATHGSAAEPPADSGTTGEEASKAATAGTPATQQEATAAAGKQGSVAGTTDRVAGGPAEEEPIGGWLDGLEKGVKQWLVSSKPENPNADGLDHRVHLEGRPVQNIIVSFFNHHGRPMSAANVELVGEKLVAKTPGTAELELKLPFGVDWEGVDAVIQNDSHLLVKLPYAPIAHSRGWKPTAMAAT